MQQKNTIIWCMLTQIWSDSTDIIFCHLRPFFAFLSHYWPHKLKFGKNVKKQLSMLSFYTCVPLIKIIWYMVHEIWSSTDRSFLSHWAIFCLFTPVTPWKMKISKMKKNPGDIIILHKCIKNHYHLLYCSRHMAHDGCNCYFDFVLSGIFPNTFLQPVSCPKNSILNWVIKLNLIKRPMKFYSSKKNWCHCRQTTCRRPCFCSQRECRK